jgi:hypothetical protein
MNNEHGAFSRILPIAARGCAAAALALLCACGGGGGGGGAAAPVFSIATKTLTFSANINSAAPASQAVSGSVSGSLSGTLYILVQVTGPAVSGVTQFVVSGNSGSASVNVQSPNALGVGTYSSVLTVTACLNDATCATGQLQGSPQTINVTYTVTGPAIADVVEPRTLVAGTTGNVVIRGSGLTGTSAVSFGTTAAPSFSVVSDSLIEATYPATLGAGVLAVNLTGSAQAFTGSVAVVGPEAYPATVLTYPQTPARIIALVFDAERQVLYVAASFGTDSNPSMANNQLWRYSYSGGAWSQPSVLGIPYLRDVALPGDGSKLEVLTDTAVQEFDAGNPVSATRTVTASFTQAEGPGSIYLARFAFANDGNAVVGVGEFESQDPLDPYLFNLAAGTFTDLGYQNQVLYSEDGSGTPMVASANGALAIVATGIGAYSSGDAAYSSVTRSFGTTGILVDPVIDQPPAIDSAADRIIFNAGTDGGQATQLLVANGSYSGLGYVPGPGAPGVGMKVFLINPLGTRAYVLNSDATLHAFDLTANPDSSLSYPELGNGLSQAIPSTVSPTLRTAVTPDGATLFIAGDAGVAVIPAPQ